MRTKKNNYKLITPTKINPSDCNASTSLPNEKSKPIIQPASCTTESRWQRVEPDDELTSLIKIIVVGTGAFKFFVINSGIIKKLADGRIDFRADKESYKPGYSFMLKGNPTCKGFTIAGVVETHWSDGTPRPGTPIAFDTYHADSNHCSHVIFPEFDQR